MNAHDPRPENGAGILSFARLVIPRALRRPLGEMRVEFREDDHLWRVVTEHGGTWKVLPDYELAEGILFEIEARA
jgi:hypothetical protein